MTVTTGSNYLALVEIQQLQPVDTAVLFKVQMEDYSSPIDKFISSTNVLNKIYLTTIPREPEWSTQLATLTILGYMSAIESYVRAILTGLINIDEFSRNQVGAKQVTFAIATSDRDPKLLPEALIENTAFSTSGNIEKALKDLIGIVNPSKELTSALLEFKELCEIRHCCVHRFGKLGSQNALNLGFDAHRGIIEHPFSPTESQIVSIFDTLQLTVRILNNFVFREVLDRTVSRYLDGQSKTIWHWKFNRDRARFAKYYNLFACVTNNPKSALSKDVYIDFRDHHAARVAAQGKKKK